MRAALLGALLLLPLAAQAQDAAARSEWHVLDGNRCVRTATMMPGMASPEASVRWLGQNGHKGRLDIEMMPGRRGSTRMEDIQSARVEWPPGNGSNGGEVDFFPSFEKCVVFGNVIRLYEGKRIMPPQDPRDTTFTP